MGSKNSLRPKAIIIYPVYSGIDLRKSTCSSGFQPRPWLLSRLEAATTKKPAFDQFLDNHFLPLALSNTSASDGSSVGLKNALSPKVMPGRLCTIENGGDLTNNKRLFNSPSGLYGA
jgi:hypothetical protein